MVITDAFLAYRYELRQKDVMEDRIDDFSTFLGQLAHQLIINTFTQEAVQRWSQGLPEDESSYCSGNKSMSFKTFILFSIIRLFPTHCAKKIRTLPKYKPADQLRCCSCHQSVYIFVISVAWCLHKITSNQHPFQLDFGCRTTMTCNDVMVVMKPYTKTDILNKLVYKLHMNYRT